MCGYSVASTSNSRRCRGDVIGKGSRGSRYREVASRLLNFTNACTEGCRDRRGWLHVESNYRMDFFFYAVLGRNEIVIWVDVGIEVRGSGSGSDRFESFGYRSLEIEMDFWFDGPRCISLYMMGVFFAREWFCCWLYGSATGESEVDLCSTHYTQNSIWRSEKKKILSVFCLREL